MKSRLLCCFLLSLIIALSPHPVTISAVETRMADSSSPTVTTTSAPATETLDAELLRKQSLQLRDGAIELALRGEFSDALTNLERANELAPDPGFADEALRLLDDYATRRAEWDAQQRDELAGAVHRVRLGLLSQSHLERLNETGLGEKLRKQVRAITSACEAAGTAEGLIEMEETQGQKRRNTALEKLGEASKALEKGVSLLKGHTCEYSKAFLEASEKVEECFGRYRRCWKDADLATPGGRRATVTRIEELEYDLFDAMGNLGALTGKRPWYVALLQGNMARGIASDKQSLTEQQWYKELISLVDKIARDALDHHDWDEALDAYGGLAAMVPEDEQYEQLTKKVRRHVRVQRLYGRKEAQTQPATLPTQPAAPPTPAVPGEFRIDRPGDTEVEQREWERMVRGVDVEFIRIAIDKVHMNYVSPVDYRKLARGALMSVKVLGETQDIVDTFPGLSHSDKREEFLRDIEGQLDSVEKDDRVDEEDLIVILNAVVHASERSVRIPASVIALEFANGMLDELDRFSSLISPSDVSDFEKNMRGRFFGVGIQITKERGKPLKVVTPLLNTPAYLAGIKSGDSILAVEGIRTDEKSLDWLVRKIMGPKGTRVVLTISRPGLMEPRDVEIVRDEIHIRTVKGWRRRGDGRWDFLLDPDDRIGYLRIEQFTEDTHSDVAKALDRMRTSGVMSLVLDLRTNPGGLLLEAVKLADEFLRGRRKNNMIVSTRCRGVLQSGLRPSSSGRYLDGDLIVLVDEISASAAEIVSGAIQDYDRGTIVGERTFGKGSVQKVLAIDRHDGFLKLTSAYYYLPNGRLLHRKPSSKTWGVDPDVRVWTTPRQMRKWRSVRSKTDLIRDIDPEELEGGLERQYEADMQLQTAVLLLKLRQLKQSRPLSAAAR